MKPLKLNCETSPRDFVAFTCPFEDSLRISLFDADSEEPSVDSSEQFPDGTLVYLKRADVKRLVKRLETYLRETARKKGKR